MICISPITLKKEDNSFNTVPCGKCYACVMNYRTDWIFRLTNEFEHSLSASFVTLTYDDEHLIYADDRNGRTYAVLDKDDVQKFIKRFRYYDKRRIRYYIVGEYGEKSKRPHYHAIIFNHSDKIYENLQKAWKKGFIHCGSVTSASITYVTKYLLKKQLTSYYIVKPFALMSKNPAIGLNYLNYNKNMHKSNKDPTVKLNGKNKRMPRYYRDKIFSKLEKEIIRANMYDLVNQKKDKNFNELFENSEDPFKLQIDQHKKKQRQIINSINQNEKL